MSETEIMERLDTIEQKLEFIARHMVDVDMILTSEERRLLDESVVREKKGLLKDFEEVRRVRSKTRQAAF